MKKDKKPRPLSRRKLEEQVKLLSARADKEYTRANNAERSVEKLIEQRDTANKAARAYEQEASNLRGYIERVKEDDRARFIDRHGLAAIQATAEPEHLRHHVSDSIYHR